MGLRTLNHAKPQHMRFFWGRFAASWYNNLKAAAYAAARVRRTRFCANAQGFENIEPRKTAASAVLLWPPAAASWYNNLKAAAYAATRALRA